MLSRSQPSGDFLIRAAAAYPADLNKELAHVFQRAVSKVETPSVQTSLTETRLTGDLNNVVKMGLLRGQQGFGLKVEDGKYSLRNIHSSVNEKTFNIGKQIANLIEMKLAQGKVEDMIISNIGRPMEEVVLPHEWLDGMRSEVVKVLSRNRTKDMPSSCDVGVVDREWYQTAIIIVADLKVEY